MKVTTIHTRLISWMSLSTTTLIILILMRNSPRTVKRERNRILRRVEVPRVVIMMKRGALRNPVERRLHQAILTLGVEWKSLARIKREVMIPELLTKVHLTRNDQGSMNGHPWFQDGIEN